MVNTGNTRRESAQAYLIPLLAEAGFNVVADNCEALPCVFETRLPGAGLRPGDVHQHGRRRTRRTSTTLRVQTDPDRGERLPGPEPVGLVQRGGRRRCSRQPTSNVDEDRSRRAGQGGDRAHGARTSVLLPTLQFPNIGAYRTDKVANTQAELANYRAVNDWYQWEDVDGDGPDRLRCRAVPGCRTARTRSPSAPTRRGSCGPRRSRCCRRRSTPRPTRRTRSPRCWPASRSSRSSDPSDQLT